MIGRRLAWLAGSLLARIPRRTSYWLAAGVADALFAVWPKSGLIVENMARIAAATGDPRPPRLLARLSLRNYAYYLADFLRFSPIARAELERSIRADDRRRLEGLIAAGRGLILAGMHMGNWDYAGSLMGLFGHPFYVVTDTLRPARVNAFVQGRRRAMGMTPIPLEQAARGAFRALRSGATVGLLIDRPTSEHVGIPVEFFGRTCFLPAGAAALSLRTGAPVVPATMFRQPDGSYQMAFEFDLQIASTGHAPTDVQALAQQIVQTHETWISAHPEQWYMFRRMWPGGPAGRAGELALADRSV